MAECIDAGSVRRNRRVPVHARWLGTVDFRESLDLQTRLHRGSPHDHLLLLEHPHVYTLGLRATSDHILTEPTTVGADLVRANRGGDVTYHGPGQLVGYPVMSLAGKGRGTKPDSAAYVHAVEQVLIDALADLGLPDAGRICGLPGVWLDLDRPAPRKIAAIGVRISRGRTMHGFALNVDPDLTFFDHIVPCGITDKGVTSLAAEGVEVSMRDAVEAVVARFDRRWGPIERQDLAWRVTTADMAAFTARADRAAPPGTQPRTPAGPSPRAQRRLREAGVVQGLTIGERKPAWLRAKARMGPDYLRLKSVMRNRSLVTVCEEAGCPNIFECWADGTATFMINGERCTRACGFCDVDTRRPGPVDPTEADRVADAVVEMGLAHAVITTVARDDLADGGAAAMAATIRSVRARRPQTMIEVLISDCRGDPGALQTIFDAAPDVLNHNIETVVRLQRAVRPSAGYARSLAVLARARAAGLTTKSGLIVGLGETDDEVAGCLADLAGVGCDIVTIGQYLRPTESHLPVHRWVTPETFDRYRTLGQELGIGHVEASPLTRSSYHARQAADAAGVGAVAVDLPRRG